MINRLAGIFTLRPHNTFWLFCGLKKQMHPSLPLHSSTRSFHYFLTTFCLPTTYRYLMAKCGWCSQHEIQSVIVVLLIFLFLDFLWQVQEHQFLKVNYKSTVDWRLATDYLQCNPSFHGHEQCDCILICINDKDGNDKNIFVHILLMHTVGSKVLDLALVLPMDLRMGLQLAIDWDLQLTCLHAWPMASSKFIMLHSIILGVLVVLEFAIPGDYFLINYVDTNIFHHSQRQLF